MDFDQIFRKCPKWDKEQKVHEKFNVEVQQQMLLKQVPLLLLPLQTYLIINSFVDHTLSDIHMFALIST